MKDLVISAASLRKMSTVEKNTAPFPDFFAAAQNDFAARMHWSVSGDLKAANHTPLVRILGPQVVNARSGGRIRLKVAVNDPDGDGYTIKWWQFFRDQYSPVVTITEKSETEVKVLLPSGLPSDQAVFIVVEVTDKGSPALTSYQMVRLEF